MPTYFHVAPMLLGPGSTILPGNWGRLLHTHAQVNPNLFRDVVMEYIRATNYPDKPSRLNCVFLLESLEEAMKYRNSHAPTNNIYEVRGEAGTSIHRASYEIVNQGNAPVLQHMQHCAEAYWSVVPMENVEILFAGQVTVVAQCE